MIYYHFNIPTVGPFRCADSHIGFIGGIYIARVATGFHSFTAWTIVLPSGFYRHLHFFFSFPPLKLP